MFLQTMVEFLEGLQSIGRCAYFLDASGYLVNSDDSLGVILLLCSLAFRPIRGRISSFSFLTYCILDLLPRPSFSLSLRDSGLSHVMFSSRGYSMSTFLTLATRTCAEILGGWVLSLLKCAVISMKLLIAKLLASC